MNYENDAFERFADRGGFAPSSSADWAWLQHVLAPLDTEAKRLDAELKSIFTGLGYPWAGDQ